MIIETERLVLRPFTEEDAGDVLEYLREPAVNCFACMKLNFLEEAKAEMQKRCGETEYYFAITLKDTGKVIGEIEAYPETGEQHSDENDPKDTFSPCWMLNKDYQGKGYAYEAAHAFFDYLFKDKGARRIYAYTEDYNTASQHLCEKLGMKLSITLDTLTARILKLSSDSQSRIEPTPLYSRRKPTDCRADPAVAPVAHEISPDHRF